jgi:hypothetical protein
LAAKAKRRRNTYRRGLIKKAQAIKDQKKKPKALRKRFGDDGQTRGTKDARWGSGGVRSHGRLCKVGFLFRQKQCDCGGKLITVATKTVMKNRYGEGSVIVQCNANECRKVFNVTKFSHFPDIRVSVPLLESMIKCYCRGPQPPSVSEAARELRVSASNCGPLHKVFQSLRGLEASAQKANQHKRRLSGDLEADATAIRRWRNGNRLNYLQAFAIAQRTTQTAPAKVNAYILPIADVPAGSVPPVESYDKVKATRAFQQIDVKTPSGRDSSLSTDGARLYPRLANEVGIRHYSVSHAAGEFCTVVRRGRQPSLDVHTGLVDKIWGTHHTNPKHSNKK